MTPILIATGNTHKTAEIRQILGSSFAVTDLSAHPHIPVPAETGSTFLDNATLKAVQVSLHFNGLVLSDDSGLEVDALGGAPGVWSARYAGERASDAENREKLLRELARLTARDGARDGASDGATTSVDDAVSFARTARFRCVMVLARQGEVEGEFDGSVEGRIIEECRGEGGFGYDPLFIPDGYSETFAQLPAEVKNQLSHRARALVKAKNALPLPKK